jgi:hypothetical protein
MIFKKNKKGFWLTFSMFLMLLLVLGFTLINIHLKQKEFLSEFKYIGTRSQDLMNTYAEGQLELIYYDSLGRIIFPRALYSLGDSGGFYTLSDCGNFAGYQLWINETDQCKPNYLRSLGQYFNEVSETYKKQDHDIKHIFSYLGQGTFVASAVNPIILENEDVTYSVRPSFKLDTSYDLDLYDLAFDRAEKLQDECMNVLDFQSCIKEKLVHYSKEDNNIRWTDDCSQGEERIFYSFVKQYEDCINSIDNTCVCEINMDIARGDISNEDFEIKIDKFGNITMNRFHRTFDFNPAKYGTPDLYHEKEFIKILLRYGNNGQLEGVKVTDDSTLSWSLVSNYFSNDNIFVFKSAGDDYFGPENVFVNDKLDLPYCGIFTRTARVCVEQGNEFSVYDGFLLRNTKIPLKFGIFVPDIIPPDKIKFNVTNDEENERSVKIEIQRSQVEDISHYNIYFENETFTSLEDLEIKLTINDRELTEQNHTFAFPVDEDEVVYYTTITPVDVFDNENLDFVVEEVMSEDNLAPGVVILRDVNLIFDQVPEEQKHNFEIVDVASGNIWNYEGLIGSILNPDELIYDNTIFADFLKPPVQTQGAGLPSQIYIDAIENIGWNSEGKSLKQLILETAIEYNVHPALLAAQATQESGMGTNNNCVNQVGLTALTGCGWPKQGCSDGCINHNLCGSDAGQLRCTANVLTRAYKSVIGEDEYSVYPQCQNFANTEELKWQCILCTYVHGFTTNTCDYKNNIYNFYAQWSNYFSEVS